MPVRIRLARYGHRNLPFYRIYVADGRAPRDGRHIEIIGHYDPKPGASPLSSPETFASRPTPPDRPPPSHSIDAPLHGISLDRQRSMGTNTWA